MTKGPGAFLRPFCYRISNGPIRVAARFGPSNRSLFVSVEVMAEQKISREDARAKGLKRFFTGEPCKRGHIDQRYVSTTWCVRCHKEDFKRWYDANPDHFAAKARRRRTAKPEWYKENYDRWLANNYERKLDQNRGYRARKMNAGGSHTPEEVAALLDRQRWICANPYCGADLKVVEKQLDHVVPLARGGSDAVENLQWLCEPCNRRKYSLDAEAWLEREAERITV